MDDSTGWFSAQTHDGVLFAAGNITGPVALDQFCSALERDLLANPRASVLDVDGIEQWSLVAQTMVLVTARRKRARGGHLLLRGGSASLHEQSSRLGLFERVATVDVTGEAPAHR